MDFLKVVGGFVEDAVDFVVGVEQFDDDDSSIGYSGGVMGFLDSAFDRSTKGSTLLSTGASLLKTGAGMYLKSQREDAKYKAIKNPTFRRPDLIRGRNQESTPSRSQPRNPVGLNNPAVRGALQRMGSRSNFSPQLQRIVEANMTARQGRRTIGLGTTQLARVTPAPAARVRKVAKEEIT